MTTNLARIYLDELRKRLDPWGIPLFEPDTPGVRVGTFGVFRDGRFDPRGHIEDRGLKPKADTAAVGNTTFASTSKVGLGASTTVKLPDGTQLARASLTFENGSAVVACFSGMTQSHIRDQDSFDNELRKLYFNGAIPGDRVVVYQVRAALGGTVLVTDSGGFSIGVEAAAPGGTITWAALGAGVELSGGQAAGYAVSGAPMVAYVKVKRLNPDDNVTIQDAPLFNNSPSSISPGDLRLLELDEEEL